MRQRVTALLLFFSISFAFQKGVPAQPPATTTPTSDTPSSSKESGNSEKRETSGFDGLEAGEAKEVDGIKFHWCPPGKFVMGSPKSERSFGGKHSDDEDQVPVELTSGFWLGETEVSQGQWKKIIGTTPWSGQEYVKDGPKYPATYVDYDDALSFASKLTNQERESGRLPKEWKFSLPTEAQWEYACRAGTKTQFFFGQSDSRLGDYAWYGPNSWSVGEKCPHEVGLKKPNAWGLKDIQGNVLEWSSDWYHKKLQGGKDPVGPSDGKSRVLRGGGGGNGAISCRSAYRLADSPAHQTFFIGFRLAIVRE